MPERYTISRWGTVWQRFYPGNRSAKTKAHNDEMCRPFVRRFGHHDLAWVTRLRAQRWAVQNPGQVRYLRLMFAKAVKAGLIEENPWAFVEVSMAKTRRVPPTTVELERLVAAARRRGGWWDGFADLMIVTAYTGARLEEGAGVQATDVLEAGRRLVLRGKRRPGEKKPRERTVAVFGEGVGALQRQRPQVGLVWRSKSGRPLNRHLVGEAFQELAKEAGYRGSWHCLRHFCASWLLDHGASRQDVAVQLGHYSETGIVDETQVRETYGHVDVDCALARLESAVGSDGAQSGEGHDVEGDGLRGHGYGA